MRAGDEGRRPRPTSPGSWRPSPPECPECAEAGLLHPLSLQERQPARRLISSPLRATCDSVGCVAQSFQRCCFGTKALVSSDGRHDADQTIAARPRRHCKTARSGPRWLAHLLGAVVIDLSRNAGGAVRPRDEYVAKPRGRSPSSISNGRLLAASGCQQRWFSLTWASGTVQTRSDGSAGARGPR